MTEAQSAKQKVDSVFKLYFKAIEIELFSEKFPPKEYPEFYYSFIDKINSDTVYINKYIGEAIFFMENITNIKDMK